MAFTIIFAIIATIRFCLVCAGWVAIEAFIAHRSRPDPVKKDWRACIKVGLLAALLHIILVLSLGTWLWATATSAVPNQYIIWTPDDWPENDMADASAISMAFFTLVFTTQHTIHLTIGGLDLSYHHNEMVPSIRRVKVDSLVEIPHNRPGDSEGTFRVPEIDDDDMIEVLWGV